MLIAIVIILIILWFFGYAPLSGLYIPNFVLFTINNRPITLWEILILFVIGWAIGILPNTLQTIATIFLALWILSVLGIIGISGLSNVIVFIIIIGLIVSIFL